MDFQVRKKYYNLCDPYEPLEPDDERNVDVDIRGEQTGHMVRGINWVDNLVMEYEFSDKPVFKLFTGLPGSGKTTELKRLAKRLSDPARANLFPVYIDAMEILDINSPIDVTDIISAVIFSVEKTFIEQDGGNPEKALSEGYFNRLWNWLQNTDLEIGKGEFSIPSAGKLPIEMKTRPTLRRRVREAVASHFSGFIVEAKEALTMLDRRAEAFDRRGIVIIFDSIEKLKGISSNWHAVLDSAEQVFGGNEEHLRLPVHVLYTIPAALAARRIMGAEFLPMIKVREKDRQANEPGIEIARELIRRRVPDDMLKEIFGPGADERVKELILRSGGYPREIFLMLRESILQKNHPLSDRAFRHIIQDIANQYRLVVFSTAFDWLARVAKTRFLTIKDEQHRQIADSMLFNHAVMQYLNDELWFDLHPAVYEIPGVQDAIHELERTTALGITG